MRSFSALLSIALLASTSAFAVQTAVSSSETAALTEDGMTYEIAQLTRMIEKNVAGSPGDRNAIEGNELLIIQSPRNVYIVGNILARGAGSDALDTNHESLQFSGIYYSIEKLDRDKTAQRLTSIQSNSAFPTFMTKKRYKGFIRINQELLANEGNIDLNKAKSIYQNTISK